MAFCPADCSDVTLTSNPVTGNCDLALRQRHIDRIMFFTCDTDLPAPFTCEGLSALVDANKIVFSSGLANIDVQDPSFEELQRADCVPTIRVVSTRVIAFQDRIAIDIPESNTSPVTNADPFFNYEFWQDKINKQESLRYAFVYCDGSVEIAKTATGAYMQASLDSFKKYDVTGSGNSRIWTEYIQGQLNFQGDPLALSNKAQLDADGNVFDISTCNFY